MSQVEELFKNMTEEDIALYTAEPEIEPHIVVGKDRFITVPEELKRIAVQYDHNIETVTFDCPRYWDGYDMSQMKIYINYMRPDNIRGMCLATDVIVDELDDKIMHFNWTITKHAALRNGSLSFLVCIKKVDTDGNEENHWNSELNQQMFVSEGLECEEEIVEIYPAIITQLLTRMDVVELIASPGKIEEYVEETLKDSQTFIDGINKVITPEAIQQSVGTYLEENPPKALVLEANLTTNWTYDSTNGYYTQNINAADIKETHAPILDVKLSGNLENMKTLQDEWSKIVSAITNDGSITFYASEQTTINLTVIIKVGGISVDSAGSDDDEPISLEDLDKIFN